MLDVLHVICTWLRPGHLTIHVVDSSQHSEEIVKNLELHLWMQLLLLLCLTIYFKSIITHQNISHPVRSYFITSYWIPTKYTYLISVQSIIEHLHLQQQQQYKQEEQMLKRSIFTTLTRLLHSHLPYLINQHEHFFFFFFFLSDVSLYCELKEFWGNGDGTHVNSKGKIPYTGKKIS